VLASALAEPYTRTSQTDTNLPVWITLKMKKPTHSPIPALVHLPSRPSTLNLPRPTLPPPVSSRLSHLLVLNLEVLGGNLVLTSRDGKLLDDGPLSLGLVEE
jgi:hypothetical protein